MSNQRSLQRITHLIIHCAATPNGKVFTAKDIDNMHAKRGFIRNANLAKNSPLKHIGYHFFIRINGAVESARRLDETGAHCLGYNSNSIGICLCGTDRFTLAQWQALKNLVELRLEQFPHLVVLGHRDTSPDKNGNGRADPQEWIKICPGFDVKAWLQGGKKPLIKHLLDAPDAPLNPVL